MTDLSCNHIEGDRIEVFKILNDENINRDILKKIKTGKRTKGHELTLVKEQSMLDVIS